MAVVAVKSNQITNRDASPRVFNNARTSNGEVRHARDTFVITNGDSAASVYRVCSIPSRAIPISVRVTAPDIGTTTAADVGLYRNTVDGGAVVDADFFGSAVSLSGGAISKSEVVFESGVITLANSYKPIWELLGLTADPGVEYDVALTLTGAADAGGTGLLEVDFAV
jgi:hypothetical protein